MNYEAYSRILIARISEFCTRRGLSYNRLARMSNLPQSTIDNIMRGVTKNPSLATVHQIALGLGMTPAEFLDFPALNDFAFDRPSGEDNEDA